MTSRITAFASDQQRSEFLSKAAILAVVIGVGVGSYYATPSRLLSRNSADQMKALLSFQMMTSGGFWDGIAIATIFNVVLLFIGLNKFKEHFMEVNKVHTKFDLLKAPTPEVIRPKKLPKKSVCSPKVN